MKVGILNFQYTRNNYGALLQAAALERLVRDSVDGVVEHICFVPPKRLGLLNNSVIERIKKNPLLLFSMIGRHLKRLAFSCSPVYPNDCHVFDTFRDKYIKRTERISDLDQLSRIDWEYDVAIVGSDQVWRLQYLHGCEDVFFLNFLPTSCRRIAYAASFGIDKWEGEDDEKLTAHVRKAVQKFSAVSVREKSGVAIVQRYFGVKAEHVLDPVLQIGRSFFEEIIDAENVQVSPIDISYYSLRNHALPFSKVFAVTSKCGLSSTNIYFDDREGELAYYPVPEWLDMIRQTRKYLITDSFHAACFAILFEVNFLFLPAKQGGMARIESLMWQLGLKDQIVRNVKELERAFSQEQCINYAQVNLRLTMLRKTSSAFLSRSLS